MRGKVIFWQQFYWFSTKTNITPVKIFSDWLKSFLTSNKLLHKTNNHCNIAYNKKRAPRTHFTIAEIHKATRICMKHQLWSKHEQWIMQNRTEHLGYTFWIYWIYARFQWGGELETMAMLWESDGVSVRNSRKLWENCQIGLARDSNAFFSFWNWRIFTCTTQRVGKSIGKWLQHCESLCENVWCYPICITIRKIDALCCVSNGCWCVVNFLDCFNFERN